MSPSSRKTHVLLTIAGLHHGGAERVIANLCRYLDSGRYRVSVFWHVALGEIGQEISDSGIEMFGFPEQRPGSSPYKRFLYLRDLIREEEVDVVHSHDTACLADASQARLLAPGVKHLHTFHFGNYPNLRVRYLWMERVFSRLAHRLVAVGHEQGNQIKRALWIPDERLETVYNGVVDPLSAFESEEATDRSRGVREVVIGSVSTLTEQKGITHLLDVARLVKSRRLDSDPTIRFVIVGDGPLRQGLEAKSRRMEVEDIVEFRGWIPDAARRVLPLVDVLVQTSLWEANSMVLLEAMAASKPVVSTDVGESRHVISQGVDGYVVPVGDVEAMSSRVLELCRKPELRCQFATSARKKFLEHYTAEAMTQRYAAIYETMMSR